MNKTGITGLLFLNDDVLRKWVMTELTDNGIKQYVFVGVVTTVMCLWRAELLTGLLLWFRLLAIPISAYSPHSSVPICHCPFPNSPQNRHLLSSHSAPVRISEKTLDFWKAEPVLTTYICRHTKLAHRQKCWMKSLLFILFQPHIFNSWTLVE